MAPEFGVSSQPQVVDAEVGTGAAAPDCSSRHAAEPTSGSETTCDCDAFASSNCASCVGSGGSSNIMPAKAPQGKLCLEEGVSGKASAPGAQGSNSRPRHCRRSCFCCWCPRTKLGCAICCLAGVLLVGGLAVAGALVLAPKAPTWELVNIRLEAITLPGLSDRGIAPADTSNCPAYDQCGLLLARGCSECPEGFPSNMGCLCSSGPGADDGSGSGGSSPAPGAIVPADTSACPILDKCGLFLPESRGCSVCPDDTWINDGCTCRQPTSASSGTLPNFGGFLNIFTGQSTGQATSASSGPLSNFGDFLNIFTGGGSSDSPGDDVTNYPVEIRLGVDVKVHNPNILGAKTQEGRVSIFWNDVQFAETVVPPLCVDAHSTLVIPAQVIVDKLSLSVGLQLIAEILKNGGLLTVDALGSVTAEGPFGILVDTLVSCKVTTDVFHNSEIVDTDCKYDYDVQ